MKACKPVPIARGAFAFCRYSLAVILWVALLLQMRELVVVEAVILALSAILTVSRAPMIVLYTATVNKLFPSPVEILDEHAMRFAHTFGTVLCGIALLLLYLPQPGIQKAGWVFLGFIAVAKTIGALGFCAAGRLYTCMSNSSGTCCAFLKKTQE